MTPTSLPVDPELEGEGALPCREKLAFQTREQAEAAAAVDAYRYADSGLKAYKCQHCGAWHLSSH